MSDAVQCVWFKRDLRLFDHAPLVEAVARGQIVPVYVIEPEVMDAPDFDALHWGFIRESLEGLQRSLRLLGVELQLVQGHAVEVLESLRERFAFTHIWAHEETGNAITYDRDRAVAAWARQRGVVLRELPQNGVVRRLTQRDGWARRWEAYMQADIQPVPAGVSAAPDLQPCPLPTAAELGLPAYRARSICAAVRLRPMRLCKHLFRARRQHREMTA